MSSDKFFDIRFYCLGLFYEEAHGITESKYFVFITHNEYCQPRKLQLPITPKIPFFAFFRPRKSKLSPNVKLDEDFHARLLFRSRSSHISLSNTEFVKKTCLSVTFEKKSVTICTQCNVTRHQHKNIPFSSLTGAHQEHRMGHFL